MKWFIASDLHGSALYCRQMLKSFEREDADRLLLLGDILYHGPRNDLPDEYAPKEVFAMLNEYADLITCVRGNCDAEVDQMVLDFPIMAEYVYIESGDRLILATHGHRINTETHPPLRPGTVLLHGHTHVQACSTFGDCVYVNPGSLSMPKADSVRGYMLLEDGHFIWKALSGETLTAYSL